MTSINWHDAGTTGAGCAAVGTVSPACIVGSGGSSNNRRRRGFGVKKNECFIVHSAFEDRKGVLADPRVGLDVQADIAEVHVGA